MAFVVACWNYVKAFAWRLINLVFARASFTNPILTGPIEGYLWRHGKRMPSGTRAFVGWHNFVRPLKRHMTVAYETFGKDAAVIWLDRVPILIARSRSAEQHQTPSEATDTNEVVLTYLRGTLDVEKLLKDALLDDQYQGEELANRYQVYRKYGSLSSRSSGGPGGRGGQAKMGVSDQRMLRPVNWKREEIGEPKPPDPTAGLVLSDTARELYAHVERWFKSKDWYAERNIPWRYGVHLYGRPGTGKTSFFRMTAQRLELPIFIFDLASMDNHDFLDEWDDALSHAPAIILLEDVDNVFHERENITSTEHNQGLTFDCLLNAIGGIKDASGVLLGVTANDVSKVDEALGRPTGDGWQSTRPGRLDVCVELPPPTLEERYELAMQLIGDEDAARELAENGGDITIDQYRARCVDAALSAFWRKPAG